MYSRSISLHHFVLSLRRGLSVKVFVDSSVMEVCCDTWSDAFPRFRVSVHYVPAKIERKSCAVLVLDGYTSVSRTNGQCFEKGAQESCGIPRLKGAGGKNMR